MNKYLQGITSSFFLNIYSFHFILLYKKLFFFCCNKTIYGSFECIINKSALSKKYLVFEPASGCENYHEFIACIGIGTRIGIVTKFGIVQLLVEIAAC